MEKNTKVESLSSSGEISPTSRESSRLLESPQSADSAPRDKYNLFYVIIVMQGLAALLPWNSLLTASQYYRTKFDVPSEGITAGTDFEKLMPTVYTTINLVMMFVVSFVLDRFAASRRIAYGAGICMFAFIGLTILAAVKTIERGVSLPLNWVLVAIVGFCAAVSNNGYFSFLASFPGKFIPALTMGQAIAGIIPPITNILLSLKGQTEEDQYWTSVIYFIISTLLLAFSWVAFTVLLPQMNFFRHYVDKARKSTEDAQMAGKVESSQTATLRETVVAYWAIFKKIYIYALAVFFVFQVTLFVFPHFVLYTNTSGTPGEFFSKNMISFGFLFYSIGDWIGKISPSLAFLQIKSSTKLLTCALIRYLFFPILFFGKYVVTEHEGINAFLGHDIAYCVFHLLLGATNGYLGTLCMMFGPSVLPDHEKGRGGAIMVFFLAAGLACGCYTSLILNAIKNNYMGI